LSSKPYRIQMNMGKEWSASRWNAVTCTAPYDFLQMKYLILCHTIPVTIIKVMYYFSVVLHTSHLRRLVTYFHC
jgi:hypothetical protein